MTPMPADITPDTLPAFKAVLWDMDGTLVLSEPVHEHCIRTIGDEIGQPVSRELCLRAQGISHRHAYETISKELGPIPLMFEDWVKRGSELYLDFVAEIEPRENVINIIRALHDRGIKQAIFSNNPRSFIDATVKSFGRFFSDPQMIFENIVSLDDVPPKPSPDGYQLVMQKLGLTPVECLIVEDSPTGVTAGVSSGGFTIYWPDKNEKRPLQTKPNITVENLDFLL